MGIIVNIVIAIGLAVDYSAHIAHTYLIIQPPAEMSNSEKRIFKARKALSGMGSSVFHGGFSTFLAIISLASSKSYIFEVFFRMWFGIIIFGMANGFLLLPVILSFCGPLGEPSPSEDDPVKKHNQVHETKKPGSPDIEMSEKKRIGEAEPNSF